MGVVAMIAVVLGFWKYVSHRAALMLIAFLAFGIGAYMVGPNPGLCADRAWFCPIVPDRPPVPGAPSTRAAPRAP